MVFGACMDYPLVSSYLESKALVTKFTLELSN